jgi:hypothetical protein
MKTTVKVIVSFEYELEGSLSDIINSQDVSIRNLDQLKGYLKGRFQERYVSCWNDDAFGYSPFVIEGKVVDCHIKEEDDSSTGS